MKTRNRENRRPVRSRTGRGGTPEIPDKTAAFIAVGDELLSGRTRDTNFLYLARGLHELGIRLMRAFIVPDDIGAIRETLASCRHRFTYVFVSGGLGPTHDDVTVEGVARAFDVPVVIHPGLEESLHALHGNSPGEAVLKMAEIPEGASLCFSPGLAVPLVSIENIYLFPGVPELFRRKFDSIKETFRTDPFHTAEIRLERRESEIADVLRETLDRFPGIQIGSYPKWDEQGCTVKIVVQGRQRASVQKAAAHLKRVIRSCDDSEGSL